MSDEFDPEKMTDDQIRLRIARDNLAKYGSTIPPDGAPPLVVIIRKSRARRPSREPIPSTPDWNTHLKTCPQCKRKGTVASDFGIVVKNGRERPQSWCRECRSETSYYVPKTR